MPRLIVLTIISVLTGGSYASTKDHTAIKIAILGVYHFENPGLDVHKQTTYDHLSTKAQQEIAAVNKRLVGFKPDKVFIEQYVTRQAAISKEYQQFLEGEFDVSGQANEIYQLGFKVAAQLKHPNVYTVDAPGVFPYNELQKEIDRLKLNDVREMLKRRSEIYRENDLADANKTILERLVSINHPENTLFNHMFYTDIATRVISPMPGHKLEATLKTEKGIEHLVVPLDPDYIGAELAAEWYKRNIKIYANIFQRVKQTTDQKVLLIIGAGHVRILQHLFEDNPNFELVDINSILTEKG